MSEACRLIITQEANGLINVSAPMKYKPLCYDILKDARYVIEHAAPHCFSALPGLMGRTLIITMDMTGRVDVAAPLPLREWCLEALKHAQTVIEQFESTEQKMRPAGFADCLPNPK